MTFPYRHIDLAWGDAVADPVQLGHLALELHVERVIGFLSHGQNDRVKRSPLIPDVGVDVEAFDGFGAGIAADFHHGDIRGEGDPLLEESLAGEVEVLGRSELCADEEAGGDDMYRFPLICQKLGGGGRPVVAVVIDQADLFPNLSLAV